MKGTDKQMKTNGKHITEAEFRQLRPGDKYCITDKNEIRVFERFCKRYEKSGDLKAVNTLGAVNPIEDMRWLTEAEAYGGRRDEHIKANQPVMPPTDFPSSTRAAGAAAKAKKEKASKSVCAPSVASVSSVEVEREKTMSNGMVKSFACETLDMVKSDVSEAAWQVAAAQAVRQFRVVLASFLDKQNLPGGAAGFVLGLLGSEQGESVTAFILGHSLTYCPGFSDDPKFARLAKELRVLGWNRGLSRLVSAVLDPLREGLVDIVKGLALD